MIDRRGIASILFALALLLSAIILVDLAYSQTNMGPVRTPQINSTLFVGQSGYATIQSAVTFACRTGNQSFAVTILPGVTPSDSPTSVTGGCSGTYIYDQRVIPLLTYRWTGSVYALASGIANTTNMLAGNGAGGAVDTGIQGSGGQLTAAIVRATNSGIAQAQPQTTYLEFVHTLNHGRLVATGPNAATIAGLRFDGESSDYSQGKTYLDCTAADGCNFPVPIKSSAPANFATGSMVDNSPICTEASGCPNVGGTYPPAGIGVSLGNAWSDTSIDPAIVARRNESNVFTGNITTQTNNSSEYSPYTTGPNGLTLGWNSLSTPGQGVGEGDFINSHAGGGGGFAWFNVAPNTTINASTPPLMGLDSSGGLTIEGVLNPGQYSDQVPIVRVSSTAAGFSANSNGDLHLWSANQPASNVIAHGALVLTQPTWVYPGWNWDLNALNTGGIAQGTFSDTPPEGNWTSDGAWIIFNSPLAPHTNFGFQMAFPVFNWPHVPVFFLRQSIGGTWTTWWQFNGTDTGVYSARAGTSARNITPEQRRAEEEYLKKLAEIRAQAKPATPQAPSPIEPRLSTPKSSRDSCSAGAMWNDARYIYVCVRSGEIKRAAVSSF